MNESRYLNIVKGFAIYDLIALAPFALPWIAPLQFKTFASIHDALNLSGAALVQPDANQLLIVNLLGVLGVFWSIWRIRHLTVTVGVFEGWVRVCFASLMLYAILFNGASPLWLVFALIDVVAAPLHLMGYRLQSSRLVAAH